MFVTKIMVGNDDTWREQMRKYALIIISILFILWPTQGYAAPAAHYLDCTGHDKSDMAGDGTWGNPFESIPDANAGPTGGWESGDSLYLLEGSTCSNQDIALYVQKTSMTIGCYDGEDDFVCDGTRPIIDTADTPFDSPCGNSSFTTGNTIIVGYDGSSADASGSTVKDIQIKNSCLSAIILNDVDGPASPGGDSYANNVTITNVYAEAIGQNFIRDMCGSNQTYHGEYDCAANLTVTYNEVLYSGLKQAIAGFTGWGNSIQLVGDSPVVRYNKIKHHYGEGISCRYHGDKCTVEYNTVENTAYDCIRACQGGTSGTHLKIRYNTCIGYRTAGVQNGTDGKCADINDDPGDGCDGTSPTTVNPEFFHRKNASGNLIPECKVSGSNDSCPHGFGIGNDDYNSCSNETNCQDVEYLDIVGNVSINNYFGFKFQAQDTTEGSSQQSNWYMVHNLALDNYWNYARMHIGSATTDFTFKNNISACLWATDNDCYDLSFQVNYYNASYPETGWDFDNNTWVADPGSTGEECSGAYCVAANGIDRYDFDGANDVIGTPTFYDSSSSKYQAIDSSADWSTQDFTILYGSNGIDNGGSVSEYAMAHADFEASPIVVDLASNAYGSAPDIGPWEFALDNAPSTLAVTGCDSGTTDNCDTAGTISIATRNNQTNQTDYAHDGTQWEIRETGSCWAASPDWSSDDRSTPMSEAYTGLAEDTNYTACARTCIDLDGGGDIDEAFECGDDTTLGINTGAQPPQTVDANVTTGVGTVTVEIGNDSVSNLDM